MMSSMEILIVIGFLAVTIFLSFVTVQQGTIAITTIFGKFSRILRPGLNFKIPLIPHIVV